MIRKPPPGVVSAIKLGGTDTTEKEGFEPSLEVNPLDPLSRRAPSATRPLLQSRRGYQSPAVRPVRRRDSKAATPPSWFRVEAWAAPPTLLLEVGEARLDSTSGQETWITRSTRRQPSLEVNPLDPLSRRAPSATRPLLQSRRGYQSPAVRPVRRRDSKAAAPPSWFQLEAWAAATWMRRRGQSL